MSLDPVSPDYEFTIDAGTNIICRDRSGHSKSLTTAEAIEELLKIPSELFLTSALSLGEFRSRFQTPIELRQLIIYSDSSYQSSPVAALTWGFLSPNAVEKYAASKYLHKEDWRSGTDLWFLDLIVARQYSPIRWIVRDLRDAIFPDYPIARSMRVHETPDVENCRVWHNFRPPNKIEGRSPSDNPDHQLRISNQSTVSRDEVIDHVTRLVSEKGITGEKRNILIQNVLDEQLAMNIFNGTSCELVQGDHNARALTIFAQTMARLGYQTPKFTVRHSTRTSMPFDDQSFGVVVTSIYHLEDCDLQAITSELSRILDLDGYLVLAPILSPREKHSYSDKQRNLGSFTEATQNWILSLKQAGMTELELYDTSTGISVPLTDSPNTADSMDQRDESAYVDTKILLARKKSNALGKTATSPCRPPITIVTLSGGIDSTYVLWKLATTTDHILLAHHVNIVNKENRSDVETISARRVANYVSSTCRPILYSESTVNHRGFSWYGYDVMEVGFEVGVRSNSYLFDNSCHVDHWTMGACEEEGGWTSRWQHVKACLTASCYPHLPPEFLPLPIPKKSEEISELPEDLLNLTWYCRRPVVTRTGYRTCNACKTCRIVHGTRSGTSV